MKKILSILIVCITIFSSDTFASYSLQAPDGRIIAEHLNCSAQEMAVKAQVDQNLNPSNLGQPYKIIVEETGDVWLIGANQPSYIQNTQEIISSTTYNTLEIQKDKKNVIISPSLRESNKGKKYWLGNTGIEHPFKINRDVQDKPGIKEIGPPSVIYSPSVVNK